MVGEREKKHRAFLFDAAFFANKQVESQRKADSLAKDVRPKLSCTLTPKFARFCRIKTLTHRLFPFSLYSHNTVGDPLAVSLIPFPIYFVAATPPFFLKIKK